MALAKEHIPAMQALLANYTALMGAMEKADAMFDGAAALDAGRVAAELNNAMRLLTDGLERQAREAVERAAEGNSLPFPVKISTP